LLNQSFSQIVNIRIKETLDLGTNVILTWSKTTENNFVGTYVFGHNREVVNLDLGVGYNDSPFATLRVGDYNCEFLSKIFAEKYWIDWNARGLALRRRFTDEELAKIKNLENDYLVHARVEILAQAIMGEVPEWEKGLNQEERLNIARTEFYGVIELYIIGLEKEKAGLKPKVIIG
jgi:hypothetical protein